MKLGLDPRDAIDSFGQSEQKDFAYFAALSGRNAHRTYLQNEATALE